jgi:hypothetical protein
MWVSFAGLMGMTEAELAMETYLGEKVVKEKEYLSAIASV